MEPNKARTNLEKTYTLLAKNAYGSAYKESTTLPEWSAEKLTEQVYNLVTRPIRYSDMYFEIYKFCNKEKW